MKNYRISFWIAIVIALTAMGAGIAAAEENSRVVVERLMTRTSKQTPQDPVVMGYVTSWSTEMPDPFRVTHLAYAFATVDNNFTTVTIKNPERLRQIVDLKKQNPDLKVILSVGGSGAGNFSEMAADKKLRKAFCKNLASVVTEYGLDGIDMDWEVPGEAWGISASKNDRHNFTLLMSDLRKALGKKKILSFAVPHHGNFFEFKKVMPLVDFVGIMMYDMGLPPRFHNAIHNSAAGGARSMDDVVSHFYSLGVDPAKMVIGVPFYGRGNKKVYSDFADYKTIQLKPDVEERWDPVAMVPYMVDKSSGETVLTFENPRSLEAKCKYIRDLGAKGMMFWHYTGDTPDGKLLKVVNQYYGPDEKTR